MAWRFVKQPNGRLALFSDVVDTFTMYDCDAVDALGIALETMGPVEARDKVRRALEDEKPWKPGEKGDGLERWRDSLKTIERVHGKKEATRLRRLIEGGGTRVAIPAVNDASDA